MLRTLSGITSAQLFLANNSHYIKRIMCSGFTKYDVFYPCKAKTEFEKF